uniref:Uncharacterized protein n=1 Tax=Anopheles coluzzii TaxID=1518534 RepID=A0A8W7PQL2_ANOCL
MSFKKASRTKSLSLSGDDFPLRSVGGNVAGKPKAAFSTLKRPEDTLKIMKYIDDNVIGKGVAFLGPYGRRKAKVLWLGEVKTKRQACRFCNMEPAKTVDEGRPSPSAMHFV